MRCRGGGVGCGRGDRRGELRAAHGRNSVKRGVLALSGAFCGAGGVVYRLDGVRGFLWLSGGCARGGVVCVFLCGESFARASLAFLGAGAGFAERYARERVRV